MAESPVPDSWEQRAESKEEKSVYEKMFEATNTSNLFLILHVVQSLLEKRLYSQTEDYKGEKQKIETEISNSVGFVSHCEHSYTDKGCCGCDQISPGNQMCTNHVCEGI